MTSSLILTKLNETKKLLNNINEFKLSEIEADIEVIRSERQEFFFKQTIFYSFYITYVSKFIGYASSGIIIFGGIFTYIPQFRIIKKTRNSDGFSTFVCFSLLIANLLRIFFWIGHPFELPLLAQSVVMITWMLITLELCVRVKVENMLILNPNVIQIKKFTDFNPEYFWKWTYFSSYIQCLSFLVLILSILTTLFIDSSIYIESLGFAALFADAMLPAPQFYKNYVNKSTDGMSVSMILMWISGDAFKTLYFLIRNAPLQFFLCGILQLLLDIAVLFQVFYYKNNHMKKIVSKPILK